MPGPVLDGGDTAVSEIGPSLTSCVQVRAEMGLQEGCGGGVEPWVPERGNFLGEALHQETGPQGSSEVSGVSSAHSRDSAVLSLGADFLGVDSWRGSAAPQGACALWRSRCSHGNTGIRSMGRNSGLGSTAGWPAVWLCTNSIASLSLIYPDGRVLILGMPELW